MASSSIIFRSASISATIGASFGCNATAAKTRSSKCSAAATHHLDCSAEYPTCTTRSTPAALASSNTFFTASEFGAASVTISKCAWASTVGTGKGFGAGASGRSISRLWRSAIENYSLISSRGNRTGVLVTIVPSGNCPQVATSEIT